MDVDDGNIYVGSFCPKITTMMMAARVSPHHNHHRHKWQPCVSRRREVFLKLRMLPRLAESHRDGGAYLGAVSRVLIILGSGEYSY